MAGMSYAPSFGQNPDAPLLIPSDQPMQNKPEIPIRKRGRVMGNIFTYRDALREVAHKVRTRDISTPLRNTIRSFWTPERFADPAYLRAIRIDKTVFLLVAAGIAAAVVGLTLCIVAMVNAY